MILATGMSVLWVAYGTHSTLKPVPSIICTQLFRGKMHSDWFNGIEILQGRWRHGEKAGYCYPSGLEKTLSKWDIYVPLVTKGVNEEYKFMFVYFSTAQETYISTQRE
jgi:hypothetical protein